MNINQIKKIASLAKIDKKCLIKSLILILAVSALEISSLSVFSKLVIILKETDMQSHTKLAHSLGMDKPTALIFFSLLLLIVILAKLLTNILLNFTLMDISIENENRLKISLTKRYLLSTHTEFFTHDTGYFLFHFQQLTKTFSEFILLPLIRIVGDLLIVVVMSTYLILLDPLLFSVFLFVFVSFYFIYNISFKDRLISYGKRYNKASQKIMSYFKLAITGKDQIKLYSYWKTIIKKIEANGSKYKYNYTRAVIVANMPRYLVELIIGVAVTIYVTASLFLNENTGSIIVSLGVMGFAAVRLVPIINQILVSVNQINSNTDGLERLQGDLNSLFNNRPNSQMFKSNKQDVVLELKGAQLQYLAESKKIVFPNVTLHSGLITSISGKSGSGKSSLAKVMSGLVPLSLGSILVNGVTVTPDQYSLLQDICSYSPQETFILDATLEENIIFGRTYDPLRFEQAIFASNVDDFIDELPESKNTVIGSNGIRLSGGQLQRIQIARTLYETNKIMILDEPTSALNTEIAIKIITRIKQMYSTNLIIIITHDEKISGLADCSIKLKIS